MTWREAYRKGIDILREAGIEEAETDAWYLFSHVTGITRAAYYADMEKTLDARLRTAYFDLIEKRSKRIPLQHLTGVQEFMGLSFCVNEHVLIPRQDTEILVETALKIIEEDAGSIREKAGSFKILDMCTGSGCILLSILKLAGVPVEGAGVDISEQALAVACANAERIGVNAELMQSDLFENVWGKFSMIVSNPPYIRTADIEELQPEVRDHDPWLALDGKEDGLHFYREIIRESVRFLLPGGMLLFEIGYDQAEDVSAMMAQTGFRGITVKKDLAGLDRVLAGVYDDIGEEKREDVKHV